MTQFIKKNRNIVFWVVFGMVILCQIFFQYYGVFKYGYLVPPGDDGVNHYWMAKDILDGKSPWDVFLNGGYPPFFHWLIAEFAVIFNTDLVKVMLYFTPLLPVLSAISIFFLSKEIFNSNAALIAMSLYVFATRSPYQLLYDGGYPNLLAASIFLPMTILFFLKAMRSNNQIKYLNYTLMVLFSFLTFFTHHLSSFYLVTVYIFSIPALIIFLFRHKSDKSKPNGKILLVIYIFSIVLIFALAIFTSFFNSIKHFLEMFVHFNNTFPYVKFIGTAEPETILNLNKAIALTGTSVFPLGVASLLSIIFFFKFRKIVRNFRGIIICVIWLVILLIASRFTFLSNPERLIRDSVFPLTLLASGFVVYILSLNKQILYKTTMILLLIACSSYTVMYRLNSALAYNQMERYSQIDKDAFNLIFTEDPDAKVIAFSCDDWLHNILYSENQVFLRNIGHLPPNDSFEGFDYIYAEHDYSNWIPDRCIPISNKLLEEDPNLQILSTYNKYFSKISVYQVIAK